MPKMRVNETTDFLLGGNYRFKDAFAPYAGVYYKNFMISVSYDVNMSDLRESGRQCQQLRDLAYANRSQIG